jgi:DNA-binding response OmpR family regulator
VESTAARAKVLVADDNRDAADTIVWLLRNDGFDAVAAHDGEQALEIARVFKPQLAILDLDMPGLDGLTVARALRREQAPGTVLILIALTGLTTPEAMRDAREAGFDRHVAKPIPGDDLCALVSAYLAKSPSDVPRQPTDPGFSSPTAPGEAGRAPPVDGGSRPLDG